MAKQRNTDKVEYVCNQDGRISAMETKLSEVYNIVKGNGQKGIQEITIRLDQKYDNLNQNVNKIADSMVQIAEEQTQIRIKHDVKKELDNLKLKKKTDRRWMISTIITLSLGVAGLLLKIILS